MALGTRAKFQLEILIRITIFAIHKIERIFCRARETLLKQLWAITELPDDIIQIQSSAVITRSNIVRYYLNNYRN